MPQSTDGQIISLGILQKKGIGNIIFLLEHYSICSQEGINKMKKLLLFVISVLLILVTAASAEQILEEGIIGTEENGYYILWDDGILVIDCEDYASWDYEVPSDVARYATCVLYSRKVKTIGNGRFADRRNILEFTVEDSNPNYTAGDGILYSKDMKVLQECPCGKTGVITVPEGVREIADDAFSSGLLSGIILPDTLEVIGNQAFFDCNNLKSITLPKSVRSIGDSIGGMVFPFALENIYTDEANSTFISEDGVLMLKEPRTFFHYPQGRRTEAYEAPYAVRIGDDAFRSSRFLSVTFREGLEIIGKRAFESSDISEIHLPSTLKEIQKGAFNRCEYLTVVHFDGTVSQWKAVNIENANDDIRKLTVHCADGDCLPGPVSGTFGGGMSYTLYPNGYLYIEGERCWSSDNLFRDNKRIRYVEFAPGVLEIPMNIFMNCSNIEKVVIPDTVTKIGDRAFYGCESLQSIEIPASVIQIGDGVAIGQWTDSQVFDRCGLLRDIYYGGTTETWMNMGFNPGTESALLGCTVHCSDGTVPPMYPEYTNLLTSCGDHAFYYFTYSHLIVVGSGAVSSIHDMYMKDISVTEGITSIGENCFGGMNYTENVYLPVSLTHVGKGAFRYCSMLKDIYYAGTEEQWNAITFDEMTDPVVHATIHFHLPPDPAQCKNWLYLPEDLTVIGSEAFAGCIEDAVLIPGGCTYIGPGAFRNCPNLKVVFMNANTRIDETAFEGCPEDMVIRRSE